MKIIHCADMHLDSKMNGNLDKEKAKERKYELLATFLRMVDYARENGVKAIIIAGDLFDTRNISAGTRNAVKEAILYNPEIDFYYLKGNHGGADEFLSYIEDMPANLKLFNDIWTRYEIGNDTGIVLNGMELSEQNAGIIYSSLMLDPRDFNIVTLHGQIAGYQSKNDAETISLSDLKNKNIDYLALGHIHEYQTGQLPARGCWCYSGCLEGRGFDESGDHGFVVLDIDENTHEYDMEFVKFSKRNVFVTESDISGKETMHEVQEKILEDITNAGCTNMDLVKVVLTGNVSMDCEKDADYIAKWLQERFYFAKVSDATKIAVDYNDYAYDASLKGEFVRLVQKSEDLSEDMKTKVIALGIRALSGEEIEV
ncbi:metallophosphoesterase family protein [Butyrivibrio sp. NC2002]|uniref:metallophosphoesterase family protein n=1 Tax=Butyrivibrio sp. NC2002 TaxID=1410610 RepID=UPI00056109F5|nr:DNA repair exonuclease [Butyrivibrio sp. NC2002]